jgi:hypothetical protein
MNVIGQCFRKVDTVKQVILIAAVALLLYACDGNEPVNADGVPLSEVCTCEEITLPPEYIDDLDVCTEYGGEVVKKQMTAFCNYKNVWIDGLKIDSGLTCGNLSLMYGLNFVDGSNHDGWKRRNDYFDVIDPDGCTKFLQPPSEVCTCEEINWPSIDLGEPYSPDSPVNEATPIFTCRYFDTELENSYPHPDCKSAGADKITEDSNPDTHGNEMTCIWFNASTHNSGYNGNETCGFVSITYMFSQPERESRSCEWKIKEMHVNDPNGCTEFIQ